MNPFHILTVIVSIGTVIAIPELIEKEYESVCSMSSNLYNSLKKILEKTESFDDSYHSVGFHMSQEICEEMNYPANIGRSLTAYFSGDVIIIFFNIPLIPSTESASMKTFDVKDIQSLKTKSKNTFTVVWIKATTLKLKSSLIYELSYRSGNEKQISIKNIETNDLRESLKNEDQVLMEDIQTNDDKQDVNISFVGKTEITTTKEYSVRDSYLILCLVSDIKKYKNCNPIRVQNYAISCECDTKDMLTTMVIYLVFWLVTVAISIKSLIELVDKGDPKEKTDHQMAISCNKNNVKFVYLIGLRLAKFSPDFDLKDVTVDIEFLTENNEQVAPVFRFKASVLEKQILTQVRLTMFRLTKLPELKKVQCNHSGQYDGKIRLFGFFVFCKRGSDEFKVYKINKNIGRHNKTFKLSMVDQKGESILGEEESDLKALANIDVNYSYLELIWILFLNISLIAFMAHLFPFKEFPLLLGMLFSMLLSTSVAIVFSLVLLKIYKYLLISELRQQTKMNSDYEKYYFIGIRVYYVITILTAIVLGVWVGIGSVDKKYIQTFRWFCVTLSATAVFTLVYSLFSRINFFRPQTQPSEDMTVSSTESN